MLCGKRPRGAPKQFCARHFLPPNNESNTFMVGDVLSRTGAIIAAGTVRDEAT